ncbi:hypothetical protein [Paenibacillus graminis]|uniref:hypothetical protein n=1 Tax=Paenibacillus graminis TaxID=189425 RepID=UPI002DBD28E9|nr:hypothetical protein [Paenibacillus graminis]MEC0170833.1 hypothetical protein [Paenibacillus graminis]
MNQGLPDEINSDSQDAVPAGDADSNRKAAELDYRRQIADLYLKRRAKGTELSPKDELFLDELIADGVPIFIVLDGINQAFDKFKPKHKKDEIKSLSYCEGIIYSLLSQQELAEPEQNTGASEEPELSVEPQYHQGEYKKSLSD